MKHPKLRIAWSVAWGITAVLLIALWVRSYAYSDQLSGPIFKTKRLFVSSLAGGVQCRLDDRKWSNPNSLRPWSVGIESVADDQKLADDFAEAQARLGSPMKKVRIDFTRKIGWSGNTLFLSYWLLMLPIGALAVIPWIRKLKLSFSLRTLLTAITLIAVVLGTVVWLSH